MHQGGLQLYVKQSGWELAPPSPRPWFSARKWWIAPSGFKYLLTYRVHEWQKNRLVSHRCCIVRKELCQNAKLSGLPINQHSNHDWQIAVRTLLTVPSLKHHVFILQIHFQFLVLRELFVSLGCLRTFTLNHVYFSPVWKQTGNLVMDCVSGVSKPTYWFLWL